MEQHELVAYNGEELPRYQEADRYNGSEMDEHASSTPAMRLIFPVTDREFLFFVYAVVVKEHGSGSTESKRTESTNDPKWEIVAAIEAKWVIDLASDGYKAIWWLLAMGLVVERHVDRVDVVNQEAGGTKETWLRQPHSRVLFDLQPDPGLTLYSHSTIKPAISCLLLIL
jgi:hypothetical protein